MIKKQNKINFDKQTTCCFSGPRPKNLPWGNDIFDNRAIKFNEKLKTEIESLIKKGYSTFLCGMALGFDTMCADIVLKLKEKNNFIKLIGVIPCKSQSKLWQEKDKQHYDKILNQLDEKIFIYEKYIGKKCMIERNKFMVDNSSCLLSVKIDYQGGTKFTIDYAKTKNVNMILLNL